MYSEEMIPEKFKSLIVLNPFAPLIISWRSLFFKGELSAYYIVILSGYCLLFWVCSHWVYKKLAKRFAEVL
tara:strand:+ start:219 stop:431 length:213 start_codon:yes stop_codon:yes gene_type:complete